MFPGRFRAIRDTGGALGSCFDILGVTAACAMMVWKSKSSLGNKSPRANRHLDTDSGTPVERGAMYRAVRISLYAFFKITYILQKRIL